MTNKPPFHLIRMCFSPVSNESGSTLLVTVIILVLLTILGISGINTSSTDIQITHNYRTHKQNLALADAAVNRAKSLIVYGLATPAGNTWVNTIASLYAADPKYLKAGAAWDTVNTPVLNQIDVTQVIADWNTIPEITPTTLPGEPNTEFVVYVNPNSPDANSVVIARSRRDQGDVILEAGFDDN